MPDRRIRKQGAGVSQLHAGLGWGVEGGPDEAPRASDWDSGG